METRPIWLRKVEAAAVLYFAVEYLLIGLKGVQDIHSTEHWERNKPAEMHFWKLIDARASSRAECIHCGKAVDEYPHFEVCPEQRSRRRARQRKAYEAARVAP